VLTRTTSAFYMMGELLGNSLFSCERDFRLPPLQGETSKKEVGVDEGKKGKRTDKSSSRTLEMGAGGIKLRKRG